MASREFHTHSATECRLQRVSPVLTRLRLALPALTVVTLACLASGCGCSEVVDKTFRITTPAEPSLQFKIESCRIDAATCNAICIEQLANAGIVGDFVGCEVAFAADHVDVIATYEASSGGLLCP